MSQSKPAQIGHRQQLVSDISILDEQSNPGASQSPPDKILTTHCDRFCPHSHPSLQCCTLTRPCKPYKSSPPAPPTSSPSATFPLQPPAPPKPSSAPNPPASISSTPPSTKPALPPNTLTPSARTPPPPHPPS